MTYRLKTWSSLSAVRTLDDVIPTRPLISRVVDAAYAEQDPHRRIAFVAAFAMSNYSSTIGRIAKPFNPMLVRVPPAYHGVLCVHIHAERDIRVCTTRQAIPLRLGASQPPSAYLCLLG